MLSCYHIVKAYETLYGIELYYKIGPQPSNSKLKLLFFIV